MARGDQLLIIDGTSSHRVGMAKLFEDSGYVCTAVATGPDAKERIQTNFYPVAVVDVDVDRASGGLDLMRFIRERSPQTAIIGVTGRRTFEAGTEAFRLGAIDVVLKMPDQVEYLKRTVDLASERFHARSNEAPLLEEVRQVLDQAFRTLLELARHVYHDISVGAMASFRPRVLFVESDQQMVQALGPLVADKSWEIAAAISGGDALDKVGSESFDVVVVRNELPDLPGTMIVKTVQARRAETVGLLYTTPGPEGRIDKYLEGRSVDVFRPFQKPAQLIEQVEGLVNLKSIAQRDRRVIQAFRADHDEFFRRYAELKLRIDRLLDS